MKPKCNPNKGDIYEGPLNNGKMDGIGVCKFINGDRYEGEWKDGKLHGKGKNVNKHRSLLLYQWR